MKHVVTIAFALSLTANAAAADAAKPVKVFILAGQSNMQGKAKVSLAEYQAQQPATRDLYKHLFQDGKWIERGDVWFKYFDEKGNLTVGYGAPKCIGPELEFGLAVGDRYDEQVLLIKTAWGGRSLYRDFRPPSAGLPAATVLDKMLADLKKNTPKTTLDDVQKSFGASYRAMLDEVNGTLANLKTHFPAYAGQGYELAGFIWFQGWNDMINAEYAAEYTSNLTHFIRGVRRNLKADRLPFVIGQMGVDGLNAGANVQKFKAAQLAVLDQAEFKGNVALVKTDIFWDTEAEAVFKKGWRENLAEWNKVGSDYPFHYLGSPKTMLRIGRAFGAAALELGAAAKSAARPPAVKVPIILDCDIGTDIDDTFAVALAALSPELELRGVTTVSGDTHARALMVCRLLTAAGLREVPVAEGKPNQPPQALRGVQEQYIRQPPAFRASKPMKEPAVEFIYQQLKANPGEITLVAVGPLSNIAQLLTEHPDCKPWIKRLVIMGGSVRVGYNNKPPVSAEFNIRADPKASQVVFTSGLPLTIAPLDATTMLKLEEAGLQRIFGAGTHVNYHVQALHQLWDQKTAPILFDPVAVTLCITEDFCKMEDLHLEVDDKGFTRIGAGKANAKVATGIRSDDYLKWIVDRFAAVTQESPPAVAVNVAKTISRKGMPNRVHVFEDYETDIEKRWWMSGKAETVEIPPGGKRSNRGVLTQDFDGQMGDQKRMYSAVIFNPVPGPPMGKNPRLSFRYFLKGTDVLKVQIYSLSKGYHRFLTLTGLPQDSWQDATVDMTAVRRPDGSGGPLSEGERIDDIQFYADPRAELLIDDIVLYDEANADDKRPFPKRFLFTGWFDSGKQGKEWPGTFAILPKEGHFWNGAKAVANPDLILKAPWIELNLRGDRELGAKTQLYFRYRLTGADAMRVLLVHGATKKSIAVEAKSLINDRWGETVLDFPESSSLGKGNRIDAIQFLLPPGADLVIDDVVLYEPER